MNAIVNNILWYTISVARENNDLHHSYFEPPYDAYGIKKNVAPMLKRKKNLCQMQIQMTCTQLSSQPSVH